MSKSPTKKNSAKGNIDSSSHISNCNLGHKSDAVRRERGIIHNENPPVAKNGVKANLTTGNIKKKFGVTEKTEESERNNAKMEPTASLPTLMKIESVELEKSAYHKTIYNERKMDRKRDRNVSEKKIAKANERKSDRKRERKRDKRSGVCSDGVDIGGDGSNVDKVNFIRGNKFKAVDVHKKLLVIKSDEDLKKLINKENVTEEDILNLKTDIEKTDTVEERKKKNIIIPGVQMCDNYNYITTKFQRPSHYIRYELYRDQVSGVRLNDGTIIHYDMLKEDEVFLHKLNENIKTPVSDDDFSKLIDRFEKTTGKWVDGSEEINYKDALEIADELKLNYKNHILKEIYVYWKKRRKTLGKPLLRMLWANCHHNLPNYIVFRPKVKEKMTLRKHKKKNSDTIIKMHKLLEDFRRIDKILKKMRQRDEKKLLLIQLNAILFDQTKNEIIDKTYVCPMWNYFKDYKMEKIYKRFKKDKFYKNVYTNSITNNTTVTATATNKNTHATANAHGDSTLDKARGMKKGICGIKMDPFFFTYPISPIKYENVVLMKRRGRNNRIWIDRKFVSENNDKSHRICLFKEEDATHILKCCDVSEYFPDYFDEFGSISKQNDRTCKEILTNAEKETEFLSTFATPAIVNFQKSDMKEVNNRSGIEEKEEEGGDVKKKGARKRTRGKHTKDTEDLKQYGSQKKIKLEDDTLEKAINAHVKKERSDSLLINNIENVKHSDSFVLGELNSTFTKFSSTSTNQTEIQEKDENSLLLNNENISNEKGKTDLLSSKSAEAIKNETNQGLHNITSSSSNSSKCNSNNNSIIASQMENTYNLYKKYNKSLFQLDEIMDPIVNRENSLLCLNKYAQEQKRFLFYLENLLNFDNFNFEHKKRKRKASGKTAAKEADKEVNQDVEKGTESRTEKEIEKETKKEKEKEKGVEKCSSKGVTKGTCKGYEKNTEKTTSTLHIKKEFMDETHINHNTSNLLNAQNTQSVVKEITQKSK